MQQLIYFIRKFRYFLLFLFLEIIALIFTIQHHSYHTSKFVNSANFISGGFYNKINYINEFFIVKNENKLLIDENIRLKNAIAKSKIGGSENNVTVIDNQYFQKYEYSEAKVINNNYTKQNNILTIDKGTNHGLSSDLGVINSNGVIGVIESIRGNYATVLSILNTNSNINVRLKNSAHFGSLVWDGKSYNTTQLNDIPRQAIIKKGDTVITGGKSAIFPEGINIGVIKEVKYENNKYQYISVQLFNDMSAIGYVQVVKNLQKKEQKELEQSTRNE